MKILIKIGTNCLINEKNKKINKGVIKNLLKNISILKKEENDIILITSGAVGSSYRYVRKKKYNYRNRSESNKKILASIGQVVIMNFYKKYSLKYNMIPGQILLTKNNFDNLKNKKNIQKTINSMLKEKCVLPIINENDAISISDNKFKDNDELAFFLIENNIFRADVVFFLTSCNGVFKNKNIIPSVYSNTKLDYVFWNTTSSNGTGGMEHKVNICKKIMKFGAISHICSGKTKNIILKILKNKKHKYGTTFYPFACK